MEYVTKQATASILRDLFDRQQQRSILLRAEGISGRKGRLEKLSKWILANRARIQTAVHGDFKKPFPEVDTSEIYPVLAEIRHTLENLDRWAKPILVDAPLPYLGTRSEIRIEPKGVCLIIAPWNFPFNLCIGPLVSSIAAGNTSVLKPSELTPHTSRLIKEMIGELFEDDDVAVFEGGVEVSHELLSLPFDHIFFTGSPSVGKVIMKAAAEHLSSVTLELGGKSPTIVEASANLKDAAKRIAFSKFVNNGQTCIAPDYLLVSESIKTLFIEELKKQVKAIFADGQSLNEDSPDYARIVNDKNFQRVNSLLQDAIQRGAVLELSGPVNEQSRFIHPMILSDVQPGSRIMEEEIFGPLLPIVTFTTAEEVVKFVNDRPKPLALYIFSRSRSFRETILRNTSAGGVCINECLMQFTHPNLPFGGVNNSGIGKSHGKYGFLAFSNEKPVLRQKSGVSAAYLLYPPYKAGMKRIVDILLRWF